MSNPDFLIEIQTEELPPKDLLFYSECFAKALSERLNSNNLPFTHIQSFATPRRLGLLIKGLPKIQADQIIEKRGPTLKAAYDIQGNPSQALLGFLKSINGNIDMLMTIQTPQGEWVGYKQQIPGKHLSEIMPELIDQSLMVIPIKKRMRWGSSHTEFIRPVHHVILLYGKDVVSGTILGCTSGRLTVGHRFHAPVILNISQAQDYENVLAKEGEVVVDFFKRRKMIEQEMQKILKKTIPHVGAKVQFSEALLNEVTGLVEWPVALCGKFDEIFLALPKEVLISAMQDHQRYFPVVSADNDLLPFFIVISNLKSKQPQRVIHGNERVLRARLADAAFFYGIDQKNSLASRLTKLSGITFMAKLGNLHDKSKRLSHWASYLATQWKLSQEEASRAALLSKTDLTTQMVNEFPELQGIMGEYYARHDGEPSSVAQALREQYLPRFATDKIPQSPLGQLLAIADRMDTLVGAFGINQIPTGEKDPYGLRRAAFALIRILVQHRLSLNLKTIIAFMINDYGIALPNLHLEKQLLEFIKDRLKSWYLEQGISPDVFASVAALGLYDPYDISQRIQAVQSFKTRQEALALSVANKRVSNILAKYESKIDLTEVNPIFLDEGYEKELARLMNEKRAVITRLNQTSDYNGVLLQLAELRKPIDDFFDHVMVMTEDKSRRENRILLLSQLRSLFLEVADIALLQ